MKLTTQQAARAVRRSRSTIWRAVKQGKLSASKEGGTELLIDSAELERVYGPLQPDAGADPGAVKPDASAELALLRERLDHMAQENAALREDKRDLREQRDKLMELLENEQQAVKLLSHESQSWWRRFMRRSNQ